jgi:uncharacterized protein (TIGR03435 family)
MRGTIAGVALMVNLVSGLWSQAASPAPAFEVATIKPAAPDARGSFIRIMPGGALQVTNMPLRMLLTFAYDVRDFQVSGGPGWVGSERYDINAKSEPSAGAQTVSDDPRKMTDDQRKTAGQLAIHHETKEAPIYALVVAKNGPKLQESQEGAGPSLMGRARGQFEGKGALMEMLANVLSMQVGRPVVDKTGLTGKYDFKLEWTPDPGQGPGPLGIPGPDAPPPTDPNGPSLFAAVQEQLGLRLESTKGPVETIVIDRVEKPSEN